MDKLDKEFEDQMLKASVNIRNEMKDENDVHITNYEELTSYIAYEKEGIPVEGDLWCPEFNDCLNEVLVPGSTKYAPRDWEKPDGYSMGYKAQCDAIFHHLAREFVYKENQKSIEDVEDGLQLLQEDGAFKHHNTGFYEATQTLLKALKYDEMGTRHLQHAATRSVMSYTREKRGLT